MFCASCGHQNEAGFKFCASCGAPLSSTPSSAPPSSAASVGGWTPTETVQAPALGGTPAASTGWSQVPPGASSGTVPPPTSPSPSAFNPQTVTTPITPTGGFGEPSPGPQPTFSSTTQGNPLTAALVVVVVLAVVFVIVHSMRGREAPTPTRSSPIAIKNAPAPSPSSWENTGLPSMPSSPASVSGPQALPTVQGARTDVSLVEPVMCRSVAKNGSPLNPTKTFEPHNAFFCSVKAYHLSEGSKIAAVWRRPDGASQVKTLKSNRHGDYYVYFTIEPVNPWPVGSYKVFLIADDVLQQTLDFEVVAPTSSTSPQSDELSAAAHIEDAVMCRSVDARKRPVDPTTTFRESNPFYLSVHVNDVQNKTVLTRWFEGKQLLKDLPMKNPGHGSGWLSFELAAPGGQTWQRGKYLVEIYYDGALTRSVDFSVE